MTGQWIWKEVFCDIRLQLQKSRTIEVCLILGPDKYLSHYSCRQPARHIHLSTLMSAFKDGRQVLQIKAEYFKRSFHDRTVV